MKKIVWFNCDKMRMESGHRAFDEQTNVISTGNVIANTQISSHVRPYTEVECGGQTFKPGHLRDYDLRAFTHLISRRVRWWITENTRTESCWLYVFFHHDGEQRIIHGCVITHGDHTLWDKFYTGTGPTHKSRLVVDEAALYVSNPPGGDVACPQ